MRKSFSNTRYTVCGYFCALSATGGYSIIVYLRSAVPSRIRTGLVGSPGNLNTIFLPLATSVAEWSGAITQTSCPVLFQSTTSAGSEQLASRIATTAVTTTSQTIDIELAIVCMVQGGCSPKDARRSACPPVDRGKWNVAGKPCGVQSDVERSFAPRRFTIEKRLNATFPSLRTPAFIVLWLACEVHSFRVSFLIQTVR
jgi:hypothetical protein